MKKVMLMAFFLTMCLFLHYNYPLAEEGRYQVVVEESYYAVSPENEDKFVEIYKSKVFHFWKEMKKMGLIDGDIKMYSQRIHTLKPHWTFKTVVRFKSYSAIDKWLEKREEVFNKLFPGEGGYKELGKKIKAITEEHWDEFIREIPLE
ncbi:MAG: hypothetical protein HYW01_10095 [Deltaproteobacteria bacterium]|nr:hypothetical protein [Deltaproteobacteria bacterium]